MRILITNDDSISATQLIPLIKWCQKLGDVTTVVPKYEQSGKSHGIELHKPYEVCKVTAEPGIDIYTVDSTPADCVRFAVLGMKLPFDLVISGINRGYNLGTDIMYSGTAGAAFEAANLGIPAIAVSTSVENYAGAVSQLDMVLDYFIENKLLEKHSLYNVNLPPQPTAVRITCQGGPYYSDDFVPIGNNLYRPTGRCVYQNRNDMTLDTDAVRSGYITIMPMTINRADMNIYKLLTT